MTFALLLSLSLAVLAGAEPSAAASSVDHFRKALETTTSLGDAERGRLIREWFMDDLSSLRPAKMEDGELRDFFSASLNASSLARDRSILVIARDVFEELEARNLLRPSDYTNMQGVYIRLRAFDEARRFHQAYGTHAGVGALPLIVSAPDMNAALPSKFVFLEDGTLRLENAGLGEGDSVLVVADPLCHFTLDAVAAIQVDRLLREYFSIRSEWLVPDAMSFEIDAIRKWNRVFPQYPLSMVNDIRKWQGITHWDTPTFYVIKQGKIVHVVRGWPPEGRADELKAALGITQTGP